MAIRAAHEKVCQTLYLGLVPYDAALKYQEELVQARAEGSIPDTLLLLQHPHVFTTGRFRGEKDILVAPDVLRNDGISMFHTSRGGSITYHGPGQLVGYPIINLRESHIGVRKYVRQLEEVIIKTLASFGFEGQRIRHYPGVWFRKRKICSIGVKVVHHITMHGFALNVNCDLRYFTYINPCSLDSNIMTSLAQELKDDIAVQDIVNRLIPVFSSVFDEECIKGTTYE